MIDVDFLWQQLKTVVDPEIFVNIVDLGLVYAVNVSGEENNCSVSVDVTLTSPGCPLADTIINDVKRSLLAVGWCKSIEVNLVFEPLWNKNMITEAGLMELGLI
ncbi:MAG: metal-sulfur cluster assembly factor [Puniceicoccales bacterium]|jgi:metal-sulfur cluster biosynthetic enzyme|nr:metal-sulfur cluster assembly factor [Puniceicoccales bacterium]